MRLVIVLLSIFALQLAVSSVVQEGTYTLGPLKSGGISGGAKVPQGISGIIYWGDWVVLNAKTKEVIPRGEFFLHHIFIYERTKQMQSFYVSGASDERVTWGPDLPEGKYVYYADSSSHWTFSGMLSAITFKDPVLIQYTIRYYKESDLPVGFMKTMGVSFTSLPAHSEKGATEEFGYASSKAHVSLSGPQGSQATMVYAVGHVHVGGVAVNITNAATGEEMCFSMTTHMEDTPCYIECPSKCNGVEKYNALETISHCEDMNKRFKISDGIDIYPIYDSRCGYTGLHGSVFAWYAPDDQSWFKN